MTPLLKVRRDSDRCSFSFEIRDDGQVPLESSRSHPTSSSVASPACTAIPSSRAKASLFVWSRLLDRVIFQPSPGIDLHPEQLGLAAEEVSIRTEDDVSLHAFSLPSPGASRALLFLHGNTGNASHRLPNAAQLVRLGVHILLLDYRGYGLSEGTPTEEGVYADARAGLSYLIETCGIPEHRIVLFGRALGTAVAIDLARDRSLAGLILESSFPSGANVARRTKVVVGVTFLLLAIIVVGWVL